MKAALATGVAALCCLPWTIRNYKVFHRVVPLRSTFGLQLWLGNNPYYIHTWPAWLHPIDNQDERAKYVAMGEIAYMRDKFDRGAHYIFAFPRRDASLCWDRFVATWLGTPHPLRDTIVTHSPWVRAVNISNFLASLGVLGGIGVLLWRRSAYALPVLAFPVVYPCVYYVTIALLRYRHPIDPVIVLLGAIAIGGAKAGSARLAAVPEMN